MARRIRNLGQATLGPKRTLVAGSLTTLTYRFTAGHPIDDSGYVLIAFRFAGDFGWPQFDDKSALNYCSVKTNGDCRIAPQWLPKAYVRPWGYALYLQVQAGFLDRGQTITLTLGDRSHGSPGWQVQTFCEETLEFKTLVDPIATFQFKELPVSPTLRIRAGKPVKAVCVAPSQVRVGKAFSYRLKLEDRWGNPVAKPKSIKHRGFAQPGIQILKARDRRTGLRAESNPIQVCRKSRCGRFWADFHGQSEETIGSNSAEDYLTFARDCACVDIACHQGNDFQVTDAFWRHLNRLTKQFNRAGRFVTFPGYEWSGNTPLGGDRNVYFAREGGKIARSSCELLPGRTSRYRDAPTAHALFRNLASQRVPAFAFAHVGGRYADLDMHHAKIETAVEIHSAWGTFEWLLHDAFARGYRVGVVANSDGHKGRPGASYPGLGKFGSYGGLTCVRAERLERDAILAAMQARHHYATTGARMLLDVTLETDQGDSAVMGDIIKARGGQLHVSVHGTGPIERVDVLNGTNVLKTLRPYSQNHLGARIKVIWRGAEVRGRNRLVDWTGSLRVERNQIQRFVPVNFWCPNRLPTRTGKNRLAWTSVTTGGLSGVILHLAHATRGSLRVDTAPKRMCVALNRIGLQPRIWRAGGLEKAVEIVRLPQRPAALCMDFTLPLTKLHRGDNPIYVRVVQEDGHLAWSSPIYVDL